jgi:hypothetical protein
MSRLVNEENGVLGLGKGCHDLRTGQPTKRPDRGAQRYTLGSDLLTGYVVPLLWLRIDVKDNKRQASAHRCLREAAVRVRRQGQVSDKQHVVPPILDLIIMVPRQLVDAAHRPTDTVTGLL